MKAKRNAVPCACSRSAPPVRVHPVCLMGELQPERIVTTTMMVARRQPSSPCPRRPEKLRPSISTPSALHSAPCFRG